MYWAILLIGNCANLWCYKFLPMLENLVMILHIVFFVVVFIVVLVLPPTRNSAEFVFTEFLNNTGWNSDGIAWCLGLLTSAYVMVGMHDLEKLSFTQN
jgi:phosphotransferase system  glucose/maltose/N-acetylglucosamine-specific IIC component